MINKIGAIMCDQYTMGPACWGMAALYYETVANATPNTKTFPSTPMFEVMHITPDLNNSFFFPFGSIASFPKLGPNRAILTGKNELLIVVNSSIGRQGGVFTYKPASGVHLPDLRNNAQLVKVPNRMLSEEDIVKKQPIMSTDGSVHFFSTIDEDLNVTVETLTKMMQLNLSSEKVELAHQNLLTIARHNPQTDANEINQDKPSESDSSTPTIEVQRTSPTQGIDTMSPQFTTPGKGIRITQKMASQGYNPDLHYHDQTAHAFLGHAESIPRANTNNRPNHS